MSNKNIENMNIKETIVDKSNDEEKLTKKELLSLQDVVYKRRWIKTLIIFFIVTFLCIVGSKLYSSKVGVTIKYPYQIGDIKISQEEFNGINDIINNKEQTIYFIADTLILSDLAKSEGVTVTQDEINKVEYPYFKEELALATKIQNLAQEKVDNVSEDELKEFYEEHKDLFAKEGTVKLVAIQTKDYLPSDYQINTTNLSVIEKNLSELLTQGFNNRDITIGKNVLVDYDQEKNLYRYLSFIDKNITDYYTYEEAYNDLLREYNCTYGILSLNSYVSRIEETLTIKSIEPITDIQSENNSHQTEDTKKN